MHLVNHGNLIMMVNKNGVDVWYLSYMSVITGKC